MGASKLYDCGSSYSQVYYSPSELFLCVSCIVVGNVTTSMEQKWNFLVSALCCKRGRGFPSAEKGAIVGTHAEGREAQQQHVRHNNQRDRQNLNASEKG